MKKLSVKEFIKSKNKKQLIEVCCKNTSDASAAEKSGVDMIIMASERPYSDYDIVRGKLNLNITNFEFKLFDFYSIRKAAPNVFMTLGIPYGEYTSEPDIIKAGIKILKLGADAVYCSMSPHLIKFMTREKIPVIGHVGMVPATQSWTNGYKAVGKNHKEAISVYDHTKILEDAGVIGVEMELVPHKISEYITKNTEIMIISMGSGNKCDAQYLFAEDILSSHAGHIPRHAKVYTNINEDLLKIQNKKIKALSHFIEEVRNKKFPRKENILEIEEIEFDKFIKLTKNLNT